MSWLGPIRQISYTTDDLDGLVAFWETQAGVGPWSVFRNITLSMNYEGRPIVLPCDVGLAMHHEQLIELLQVHGNGPSPFHDSLNGRSSVCSGSRRSPTRSRRTRSARSIAASSGLRTAGIQRASVTSISGRQARRA